MGVVRGGRSLGLAFGGAAAALACALPAEARPGWAAGPATAFAIPEQARDEAIIAFATQAGVSVGFTPGVRCGGRAGLNGRFATAAALERLLQGSDCAAAPVDDRTFLIVRAKPRSRPSARPPAPLPAPLPAPASATLLSELVVTATKRPMTLAEAPYGLSVIGAAELAAQGAADPTDLPSLAAGVTVTNLGAGRDKILLRGLSDGSLTGYAQSTVGLYFDELRLTYNAPDPDLRWTDVQRVEVLRGPQGSLYGSGSIGGVIHVIANPPDTAARAGSISVSAAGSVHAGPSAVVEAVFNQPFGGGAGALRLAGWSEREGGFIDNVATGRNRENTTLRTGARASLLWEATPRLTVQLSLIGQAIATRDTQYAEPAIGPLARAVPHLEPHDNDFAAAVLNLRWRTDAAELMINTAYLDHHVTSRYDATAAPASLALPGRTPAVFDEDNYIRSEVTEARLTSTRPGRAQWMLGAFVAGTVQRLGGEMTDDLGEPGYHARRRDGMLETAMFGEVAYDLTPRLTLTLGGRLFATRLDVRSAVDLGPAGRRFTGKVRDGGFAPKLVLGYRISPDLTVYAQAAEGYRTSGFNTAGPIGQTFGGAPGQLQPLRRYAGDELWSLEAGVRWSAADGSARLRASVFDALWRNVQADLLLRSGLPFTGNLGDGRSVGVELEAARRFGPLTLAANAVLQDPELTRPAPGLPFRRTTSLAGAPRVSYAVLADYARPLARGWDLQVSGRYAYVGPSHLSFPEPVAPEMGEYGDLRASLALHRERLRIEIFGENLTDSLGDTFAYGNPFLLWTTRLTTPQRPRSVGVALSRSF